MKNAMSIFLFCMFLQGNAQFVASTINSETVSKQSGVFAEDNAGNLILTGRFKDNITIGGTTLTNNQPDNGGMYSSHFYGMNNPFIAKRNPGGSFAWVKKFTLNALSQVCNNQTSAADITSITTDASDNIYISGYFRGSINLDTYNLVSLTYKSGKCSYHSYDMFTAKLSPSGSVLWAKREGTNAIWIDIANSITTDASGNVIVTGTLHQTKVNTTCPGGSWGGNGATAKMYVYVVKYNPSGTKVWEKKYAASGYDCAKITEGVRVVSDGSNYYVAGYILGTATFDSYSFSGGVGSTVLLKLNASGNVVWATMFSGAENKSLNLLINNAGTDLYVAGVHQTGTLNFGNGQSLTSTATSYFLAKCATATGACQWATNPGYLNSPTLVTKRRALFLHPNQNVGTPSRDASNNLIIHEFSSSTGALVSSTTTSNVIGSNSYIMDIIGTSNGYAYVQNFQGSYDIGGTTIASAQPTVSDILLVQYFAPGYKTAQASNSSLQHLIYYPNPVTDVLTLLQDEEGSEIGEVLLVDLLGRIVYREYFATNRAEIPMQALVEGSYLLKWKNTSYRIIKSGF